MSCAQDDDSSEVVAHNGMVQSCMGQEVNSMKLRFWPLLIGSLAMIWGVAKLARYVIGISIPSIVNVYVWSSVAILIGLWVVWSGTRTARKL